MNLPILLFCFFYYFVASLHENDDFGDDLSIRPEFEIKMAFDRKVCDGRILIRRKTACQSSHVFSTDAEFVQLVLRKHGYDAFNIRINGPEVTMASTHHLHDCIYEATFSLRTIGTYSLEGEWEYSDGEAFNEVVNGSFEFPVPLDISLFRQHTVLQCAHVDPTFALKENDTVCDRNSGTIPGRWLKVEGHKDPFRWQPYGCSYDKRIHFTKSLLKFLKGKRIVFIGDSHAEMTFLHLQKRLNLDCKIEKINFANDKPDFSCHCKDRNITVDFLHDGVLARATRSFYMANAHKNSQSFDLDYGVVLESPVSGTRMGQYLRNYAPESSNWKISNADYIIFDSAQHWVAGYTYPPSASHWPYRVYKKAVAFLMDLIGNRSVIFMSSPARPIDFNKCTKTGDGRNSPRLELMKDVLIELAQNRSNIRILDYFMVTYPMLETSKDKSHFKTFPQNGITDILLHLMLHQK